MEQVLGAFGVDWRLLTIQAVNFGILLFVLWRFLYRPLMKLLDERRVKIEEGIRNAHTAQRHLKQIDEEKAGIIAKATKEGEMQIERARKMASDKEREIVQQADAKAAALLKSAEAQAKEEKKRVLEESRKELARLIVLGAEKVLKNHE